MRIRFRAWLCDLVRQRYADGRTALQLVDDEDGGLVATAKVNLPDEPLASDEVFIKDWSENQGILATLEEAGVVRRTGRVARTGFAEAVHCKLLDKPSRERD